MSKENSECKICSQKNNIHFEKYKGKIFNISELRLCKSCGIVYAFPYPDIKEVEEYYKNGVYFNCVSNQNNKSLIITQSIINHSRIKFLSSKIDFNKISKVLDIGSGNANFGYALKKNYNHINYDVVELDKSIIKNNLNIIRKKYQKINEINEEKYDLIILNFIVEHLTSPVNYITQTKNLLKKNGFIYIEVPNSEYNYKNSYSPHLFFWDLKSFKFFLKSLNFKIIFANTFGMDYDDAKSFFDLDKKYSKYLSIKFYFLKIYSIFFLERYIKRSNLVTSLNSEGGNRHWIKVLINKHG